MSKQTPPSSPAKNKKPGRRPAALHLDQDTTVASDDLELAKLKARFAALSDDDNSSKPTVDDDDLESFEEEHDDPININRFLQALGLAFYNKQWHSDDDAKANKGASLGTIFSHNNKPVTDGLFSKPDLSSLTTDSNTVLLHGMGDDSSPSPRGETLVTMTLPKADFFKTFFKTVPKGPYARELKLGFDGTHTLRYISIPHGQMIQSQVKTMLEVFKSAGHTSITLSGRFKPGFEDELKKQCQTLGLEVHDKRAKAKVQPNHETELESKGDSRMSHS